MLDTLKQGHAPGGALTWAWFVVYVYASRIVTGSTFANRIAETEKRLNRSSGRDFIEIIIVGGRLRNYMVYKIGSTYVKAIPTAHVQ